MIVGIIMSLIFFILGFVLRSGKGDWLIAGYNMLSEEEKNKYDKLALCKCIGNLLISFAILFIMTFICVLYINSDLITLFIVLILILIIGNLIYINTGNRFRKKE
jgi:succinate-acetate transporter protein